jgi:hypothetical protein
MSENVASILLLSLFYGSLIFCALLALKNLRLGRGDRKGAFRVALFLLILKLIGWIFSVHHVPVFIGEANLLLTGIESALARPANNVQTANAIKKGLVECLMWSLPHVSVAD